MDYLPIIVLVVIVAMGIPSAVITYADRTDREWIVHLFVGVLGLALLILLAWAQTENRLGG